MKSRKIARSKKLFYLYLDGEITRTEMNKELDKLEDKQVSLSFKRREKKCGLQSQL